MITTRILQRLVNISALVQTILQMDVLHSPPISQVFHLLLNSLEEIFHMLLIVFISRITLLVVIQMLLPHLLLHIIITNLIINLIIIIINQIIVTVVHYGLNVVDLVSMDLNAVSKVHVRLLINGTHNVNKKIENK